MKPWKCYKLHSWWRMNPHRVKRPNSFQETYITTHVYYSKVENKTVYPPKNNLHFYITLFPARKKRKRDCTLVCKVHSWIKQELGNCLLSMLQQVVLSVLQHVQSVAKKREKDVSVQTFFRCVSGFTF